MGYLTNKQFKLLTFIKEYIFEHNEAPTLNEIAKEFKISIPAAQLRIRTLMLKGYVIREPNKPRSIIIKDSPELKSVTLPVLGLISAGEGIVVYEESNPEMIEVPSNMINTYSSHYCLQVKGNSMIGDGIMNNDYIVVRQQTSADNGDIVVAVIKGDSEEQANLKKFYNHGSKIELRPSNTELSSKFYNLDQIEVRGKFCGLIRKD